MDSNIRKLDSGEDVAALLNKVLRLEGFFPEFKAEHLNKVFLLSHLYLYPKGTPIVEQNDPGRDLFIIQKGTLAVLLRDGDSKKCVAELKDGDIFGEIGLLRDGMRVATVLALEDSTVFRLAHSDIQYLLKHNHELGAHLDRIAQERLKSDLI